MEIIRDKEQIPSVKTCTKCWLEKPIEQFRNSKTGKWGKHGFCIPCHDIDSKGKYEENKEIRLAQIGMWNEQNPDKTNKYGKKWRKRHIKEQKRKIKKLTKEIESLPDVPLDDGFVPDF
jgi:hypothetical protein